MRRQSHQCCSTHLNAKITQIIRENRRALESGKLGSRPWWRKVDQITQRKDNTTPNLDKDFVQGLNDYFANLCYDNSYIMPTPVQPEKYESYSTPNITMQQVYFALSKIKRTSKGPDQIPYWVWKEHAAILTPVVEFLWNLSLSTQSWPIAWKEANINPLPKVDIPKEYQDFRGINVTPVIARVFERTVYDLFNKADVESYISDSQFAYRTGGNCTNALLKMQYNFLKALDNSNTNAVRLFAMDFSKAFDNVKHNLLVEKLKNSPLNPYIINWYISFLSERKQRVVCNGTTCDWKNVNKGTTQGSVSGPYLFNLFLNDLEINQFHDISLIKYADDSTILVTVSKDVPDNSKIALQTFMKWTDDNSMSCNLTKCKELVISKKGHLNNFSTLHNICQYDSLKILGVTLQSDCKFSSHIKEKLLEANKCLYIIRCLRKEGYSQEELDLFFKAIVLPKFTYGLPVYSASEADLNIIQCFLKRCYKRRYISDLVNIYQLLEKCDRRLYNKIKASISHPLHKFLPKVKESSRRLRTQSSLLPKINTERFKSSFFNRLVFKYKLVV